MDCDPFSTQVNTPKLETLPTSRVHGEHSRGSLKGSQILSNVLIGVSLVAVEANILSSSNHRTFKLKQLLLNSDFQSPKAKSTKE